MKTSSLLKTSTSVVALSVMLGACAQPKAPVDDAAVDNFAAATKRQKPSGPPVLPARFSQPQMLVSDNLADHDDKNITDELQGETKIRVGARIRSTNGPQPLWDIVKRLVSLKKMTVSWADDVDRDFKVDVDIQSTEDFFVAITNLLRQAGYTYELRDNTIIVKNKITKMYRIPVPDTTDNYTSAVGGDFLGGDRTGSSGGTSDEVAGTVQIRSSIENFNLWKNIEMNLDKIIKDSSKAAQDRKEKADALREAVDTAGDVRITRQDTPAPAPAADAEAAEDYNPYEGFYTLDKHLGVLNVTAPITVQDRVESYIDNLRDQTFRQVQIEAKIIEVYFKDDSKIGIDWGQVGSEFTRSLQVDGLLGLGNPAKSIGNFNNIGKVVDSVNLSNTGFTMILNALESQGDTKVLSNPRLTVMNGQPALISVGKSTRYIDQIEAETDSDNGTTTFTSESANVVEGVSFGVVASIVDDDRVILKITPVTTELDETNASAGERMKYRAVGQGTVGLPVVNIREMTTTAELTNNEMLVVGGLIDETESEDSNMMPGLGKIPVVKYLFGTEEKKHHKRELVILLVPTIL